MDKFFATNKQKRLKSPYKTKTKTNDFLICFIKRNIYRSLVKETCNFCQLFKEENYIKLKKLYKVKENYMSII